MGKQTKKKEAASKKKNATKSKPSEAPCPVPGCMSMVCCYKQGCVNKQEIKHLSKDEEKCYAKQLEKENQVPKGRVARPPLAQHIGPYQAKMFEEQEKNRKKEEKAKAKSEKGKKEKKPEPKKQQPAKPNKANNVTCAGKLDDKKKPSLFCGCGPPKPKGKPATCTKES